MDQFLPWVNGYRMKNKNYKEFVFFSAGPVGDHAIIIDWANRFFESSGKPSVILMKHPNGFLRDMAIPYYDHISYIGFTGWKGKMRTALFAITSIWRKRCYVLVFPIPPPMYLKAFAYFIRFFTRSRIVGLESLCGFSIPGGPFSSASFVGKENHISARVNTELFYEQANRMLVFLGHEPVARTPHLKHVEIPQVLAVYGLEAKEYIAMHLCASEPDKSLPSDRWNTIIRTLCENLPNTTFVFTGTARDIPFIREATEGMKEDRVCIVAGVSMQELLTLYSRAKVNVTVQTGNAHLINMLHAHAVTVNFKGVHMFRFTYNENGVDLYSEEGCTCNPLERKCSTVSYKGKEYMACLFNTSDEDIVQSVMKIWKNEASH